MWQSTTDWLDRVSDSLSKSGIVNVFGGASGVGQRIGDSNLVLVPGQGVKVGIPTGGGQVYVPPSPSGRRR